jgi:hypothetical protein
MGSGAVSDAAEWEVEIKVRRNGRMVKRFAAIGDLPKDALWFAGTDTERWVDDEPAKRWPQDFRGEQHG